ncbi:MULTISPECIES: Bug family tripartite tricarboxylate transporter substrate binding protein [Ramlibacter]|uniref:Tripartite tricarboxylate transporter substrate binding protein n=1 Tax=Ramlibacter pinisoli TaxID=2682844 RepID=A0A6N8IZ03_9BURK|nr:MULTISPECIES: tripartite tricarboxylate transporter substrate binding protein [Ramlibacter]MBA2961873.1 tripartite tricarboxylate transporter substrate binding protein [Ramlibacter sp. CGMCC 1.13660]MVQ31815.1 tripartite tricarboxylate transporter substrate binding protein [Ramlibacter pinisoli]
MLISRRAVLAIAATSLTTTVALAQAWPAKPIRLIVPFPAGGGTDIITREVANKIAGPGYTFIVDNKPGTGGNIGVDAAAKSAPDGYTLVMGQTSNLAINPTLYAKLPYNPLKDLTPISLVASSPLVIVTAADSPYKTLADVVKAAKEKPGSINFATSGNGTVAHLAAESFQKVAGIKLTHIPYKGAAQGATDVISGQVQLYVSSIPTLLGHIKSGKMRPIAVTSAKRADDVPQVPTIAESGYKGFEAVTWFGILGPANLPKDVVARLNADINKALKDPELEKKLGAQGADIAGSTPEQFAKLIHDDAARWGQIVKESGAKID